jgi:hypothetical protein
MNDCITICYCAVIYVYRSSQLRGKRTCLPGNACYSRISCYSSHVVTNLTTVCQGIISVVKECMDRL